VRPKPPVYQPQPPAKPLPPPVAHPPGFSTKGQRWSRGDRLPPQYRQDQYFVQDWRRHNLPPPPAGYRWYCQRGGHCFLVAIRTGIIRQTYWRDDRWNYWRRSYVNMYGYQDDIYYRECRDRPDPAGVLIGGLIGGLLGQALSGDDRDGAVFAGIIIGATVGAALTRNMDCEDRSYAYYAYYHGLNSWRPGIYRWRNPRNNHRGDFYVRSYYYDAYGFHCARYTHTAWLPGRRVASGRACRQPNGAWVFLN
jgi:surface antigen